jgi:hypothetical protein
MRPLPVMSPLEMENRASYTSGRALSGASFLPSPLELLYCIAWFLMLLQTKRQRLPRSLECKQSRADVYTLCFQFKVNKTATVRFYFLLPLRRSSLACDTSCTSDSNEVNVRGISVGLHSTKYWKSQKKNN